LCLSFIVSDILRFRRFIGQKYAFFRRFTHPVSSEAVSRGSSMRHGGTARVFVDLLTKYRSFIGI